MVLEGNKLANNKNVYITTQIFNIVVIVLTIVMPVFPIYFFFIF